MNQEYDFAIDYLRRLAARQPSPTAIAYGYLWGVMTDDPDVHNARKLLLKGLDEDEQRAGINFAREALAKAKAVQE